MFRRKSRGTASVQLDEARGVSTHAQRAAARLDSARTRALTLGVQPR